MLYNIAKPFPLTEDVLTHFVAFLYKEGLKAGTVKSYLVATRYAQIALNLGNPHMEDMARLEYVVRGVKRLVSAPTSYHLNPAGTTSVLMADEPIRKGCVDIMGSGNDVFFWFPKSRGGRGTIRLSFRPQHTFDS